MGRDTDYEKMTVAEQIEAGLRDALAHARGELTLRTTTLPAPAPKMTRLRVTRIRKKTGMSQAVFASFLNVPKKTLQSWEQGAREPKASEARLLQIFETASGTVTDLVLSAEQPASRKSSRMPGSKKSV